jgi:hypothetical protein
MSSGATCSVRSAIRSVNRRGRKRAYVRDVDAPARDQARRTGVCWLLTAAGFMTNAIGTALLSNY